MIFNTTYVVAPEKEAKFLGYIKEFANSLIKSNVVCDAKMLQVLADAPDGSNSLTYTLQLHFRTEDEMNEWVISNNKLNLLSLRENFGTSALAFSTVLQEIDL